MKDYKTKTIEPAAQATKHAFAFPDREDIPAFTCEAATPEEAQLKYEEFINTLT